MGIGTEILSRFEEEGRKMAVLLHSYTQLAFRPLISVRSTVGKSSGVLSASLKEQAVPL